MNDDELEARLQGLDWLPSDYAERAEWVHRDNISREIIDAIRAKGGKFYGHAYTYYLSKSSNIIRYETEMPKV